MKTIGAIQVPNILRPGMVIKDAAGNRRRGWAIFEDGKLNAVIPEKEKAVSHIRGLISIRASQIDQFKMIDSEGNAEIFTR